MTELPYNSYSRYLRRTYGRAYRVAVDGGFSCPNREAPGSSGCTYCSADGSRAPYLQGTSDLKEQVERALAFLRRRYDAETFILYFQAFSATNAPVGELKRIYDAALSLARFRELVVSTRPDCLDEEKARLLATYRSAGLDVWVELGLQSASEETLTRIDRGHTAPEFSSAFTLLKRHGIKVAVHLIFGLPGETSRTIAETARFVACLDPDGVKIHNLHILAGTPLEGELLKGEVTAPGPARHLQYVIMALELLPPRSLIMRLTCDSPKGALLCPRYFGDKQGFTRALVREMNARHTRQGRLFAAAAP